MEHRKEGGIRIYQVFLSIQYTGILILAIEIFYILSQRPSRQQNMILIVVIATLINFVGYLFEIKAKTADQAMLAVKLIYLGKPYIILGTFLFVMQFYRIRIPKAIVAFLCTVHVSVSILVFTCSYHRLFYSSIRYVREGYFPHLVLGHGVCYNIFTVFITAYMLTLTFFGIRQYRQSRRKQEKKKIFLLLLITASAGAGLLLYLTGWMKGYDTTLPAYLVSNLLLLYALVRYDLLDTLSIAKENVIDEFADGIFVFDRNGHILFTNPQAEQIYPNPQEIGEDYVRRELEKYAESEEQLNRQEKLFRIAKRRIRQKGNVCGTMYVAADITENYYYMKKLEKQTAYAKRANRAKSDFLAKMSHEIRTPINSVLGMNEMILRESREEGIRCYATDIKTAAQSLLSIINEILDSSKIEKGKMKIIAQQYELDSLLNDVVNMIRFKAGEKKLDFRIHIQGDLPNVLWGDDIRIRQILINLLTNAVKYTKEGMVELDISGDIQETEVLLHCAVRDTGIGIKKEDLPNIGSTYRRMEEEKNRGIEGTGLGMSIVINLLHMMGSRLQIESVYGEGSVFSFDLKQEIRSQEPIGDYEKRSRILEKEYRYQVSFCAPDARILLVDDNAINRRVFQNLIKETEIQIVDAASGEECLEKVCKEPYDLIFLDHMMPGLDGIQTLKRMKELENGFCADTPVIVLTANAVVGAKENYLSKGFDDFLSKPIDPEKLEDMIRKYLPDEKLHDAGYHLLSAEKGREKEEELPELEEFDWEYARYHLQDIEILKHTIRDVSRSLEEDERELGRLYESIEEEKNRVAYRIRVHALKSNTAMIGALLLSKLARLLEVAAMEGDTEKIKRLHPVLMDEIEKHRERMKVLEEKPTKRERLSELLEGEI